MLISRCVFRVPIRVPDGSNSLDLGEHSISIDVDVLVRHRRCRVARESLNGGWRSTLESVERQRRVAEIVDTKVATDIGTLHRRPERSVRARDRLPIVIHEDTFIRVDPCRDQILTIPVELSG